MKFKVLEVGLTREPLVCVVGDGEWENLNDVGTLGHPNVIDVSRTMDANEHGEVIEKANIITDDTRLSAALLRLRRLRRQSSAVRISHTTRVASNIRRIKGEYCYRRPKHLPDDNLQLPQVDYLS